MDENEYLKPKKLFNIKYMGISLLLFVLEAIVTLVIAFTFLYSPIYEKQIFQTCLWLIGKVIPLIIAIVIIRKYLKDKAIETKRSFKRFIVFVLISFGIFYLFEMAASYYQTAMDKLFNIGETSNQSAIVEYFTNDKSVLNIVLLFITIVIVAPLIEEIEFRKLIFDSFDNKVNFLIPSLISAFIFGFVHLDYTALTLQEIAYFPVYFIPGFALALIYHFSGRNVYATFLVHATSNLLSFLYIVSSI